MKSEETRCINCDDVGKWKNVDHLKHTKTGLSICQGCGFVTHIGNLIPKEEMKAYYQKEYRPAPSSANFFTGQTKLHYHDAFLGKFLEAQCKDKELEVFDSGAAFGMLLKWIQDYTKSKGKTAKVSGSEWTKSFKNVCNAQFGITLRDEIDESKKYDLICSYKVAEHQIDADKEIRKFVELLKPDGHVYIGVPTWFGVLSNFGMGGFDIEYYYHKDHINVWTRKTFEGILRKCGLEIINQNHIYYDSVYLCKRNDDLMKEGIHKEDPVLIEKTMERVKEASGFKEKNLFKEAIEVYPEFPHAWLGNFERNRKQFDTLGFEGIMKNHCALAIEACPENAEILTHVADVCFRYNEFEKSIQYLDKAYLCRPGSSNILLQRAKVLLAYSENTTDDKKDELLKEARGTLYHASTLSDQTKFDCLTWIYKIESVLGPKALKKKVYK